MRNYNEFLERKKKEYGDKFNPSNLNPNFIQFYNNGARIEVDFGYETKRGTIGVTTGWKPCFLLMLTKRSTGSSYTISDKDKILRVIKYN